MEGIEAYLSYASKVGMIPELHYPFMTIMEIISRGKPGGPLLPVIEVYNPPRKMTAAFRFLNRGFPHPLNPCISVFPNFFCMMLLPSNTS